MLDTLLYILYGFLSLVALGYLVLPLVIASQLKLNINPRTTTEDQIDGPARRYFKELRPELASLGFVEVGFFQINDMMPGMRSSVLLLVQPDDRVASTIVTITPSDGETKFYLEFLSDLADGRCIRTNNSQDLPAADRNPHNIDGNFPDINDTSELYAVHVALVKHFSEGSETRQVPLDLDPATYFSQEINADMEKKVTRGYWKKAGERRYTITLKGAYIMTLAELPPFKQIRRAQWSKRSNKLLAQLGHQF